MRNLRIIYIIFALIFIWLFYPRFIKADYCNGLISCQRPICCDPSCTGGLICVDDAEYQCSIYPFQNQCNDVNSLPEKNCDQKVGWDYRYVTGNCSWFIGGGPSPTGGPPPTSHPFDMGGRIVYDANHNGLFDEPASARVQDLNNGSCGSYYSLNGIEILFNGPAGVSPIDYHTSCDAGGPAYYKYMEYAGSYILLLTLPSGYYIKALNVTNNACTITGQTTVFCNFAEGVFHWLEFWIDNQVPQLSCTITGDSIAAAIVPEPYSAHSTISYGSIDRTELYWSPTSFQNWTQISASNGPDTSGNATFPSTGTYWVVGNAYDTTRGLACSGNPWGSPVGWQDCGPGCRKQVTVPTPIPTLPPSPTPPICPYPPLVVGQTPVGTTAACLDKLTFSWNAVVGPQPPYTYAIRIDDTSANGWTGTCMLVNPGDTCIDGISETFYTRSVTPGSSYRWWVDAINSCGWSPEAVKYDVTVPPCPVNNPIGWHDDSNCISSWGWTCDADDYNTPLTVHLYKDGPFGVGTYMGSAVASIPAEKGVCDACGGTCNHRWAFITPEDMKDGISHTIYAYGINVGGGNNVLLSGTPKTILCAPPVPIGFVQGIKGIVSTSAGAGNDYFEEVGVVSSAVRLTNPLGGYEPPDPNTANPFLFSNLILQAGRMRTLSVANVAFYETGWTRCYNNTGCHGTPADITPGSSVPISESSMIDSPPVSNPYADAWAHFTPLPRCTISGDSTIRVNGTGNWTTTSYIDIASPEVVVENQVGIFKTPNVASPILPTKSIGGGSLLGTIKNDCDNTSPCSNAATFNTAGLPVGTRFYVYCRGANGTLTDPPNSLLPIPPTRLHECNPFCIAGAGGCDNAVGEANPSYRVHPFDYNCNAGLPQDWMLVEIVDSDWWQTQHGNVTAGGNGEIVSKISGTSAARPYLINNNTTLYPDPYRYPGVAIYGSINNPDLGTGYLNSSYFDIGPSWPIRQWKVSAGSSVILPPTSYFEKKFPQDVKDVMNNPTKNKLTVSTLDNNMLVSIGNGNAPYEAVRGYYTFLYDDTADLNIGQVGVVDELTIDPTATGVKVIIYAPNANININAPIHFADGKAFFMLIAGGDISVDPEVGGAPDDIGESAGSNAPDLEGVFYAYNQFVSGINTTQLHIRGIVAANSVSLRRNLTGGLWSNSSYPAELFEYDPSQTLMFPAFLSLRTYSRQEIAP